MRSLRLWVLAVGAVTALLAADAPTEVVDPVGTTGNASINWTKGLLIAKGVGPVDETQPKNMQRVFAMRVARADAQRNLAEALDGVHVTAETTVKMYKLVDDQIRTQIDAYLKHFTTLSEGWDPEDKTIYQVTLAVPLKDAIGVLTPGGQLKQEKEVLEQVKVKDADPKVPEAQKVPVPPPPPAPEVPQTPPPPATPIPPRTAGPYTGLVIDTTGLHIERAMAPKIVTKDESEVWGTVHVSREFVLDTGIVGYLPTLQMACDAQHSRAGKNPLVVRAIGRAGSFRANPVVTDEDAKLITDENGKTKFLDQFKVVFVVDSK